MQLTERRTRIEKHPCFNESAHSRSGRIHLAVAPKCNIRCNYCQPGQSCANENRPGLARTVLSPEEAVKHLAYVLRVQPSIKVAGIAGPGDPLFNPETFRTFELIGARFPELLKCLSTNGLLLADKVTRLVELGIDSISVTLNALDPKVASMIYQYIEHDRALSFGEHGARTLLHEQIRGLKKAVAAGLSVKVNTIMIPGVNDSEIIRVAKRVKKIGVRMMNVVPLIPNHKFKHLHTPGKESVKEVRDSAGEFVEQFYSCKQCRADACGIPGEIQDRRPNTDER